MGWRHESTRPTFTAGSFHPQDPASARIGVFELTEQRMGTTERPSIFDIAGDWGAYNELRHPSSPALESAESQEITTWAALEWRVARLAGALAETYGITK